MNGGIQINEIGFNMLGENYISQSQNFPNTASISQGQVHDIFDDEGNLLNENYGAPHPTIKSFFKGPLGFYVNDNTYFGEAYFEVSYKDYNYAKLEYIVSRKYNGDANVTIGGRPNWFITEEYYWSIKNGTPVINIYYTNDAFLTSTWTLDIASNSNYIERNNTTNFSTIWGTDAHNSLKPHFDQNREVVKFCRSFGPVYWGGGLPPTYEQENFIGNPIYIKGLATLL